MTELLGSGTDAGLAAVDLERMGPGDYRARRQVVRVGQDAWIVLDFVSGAGANGTRTVWTTASDVELRLLDRHGAYALVTPDASARIDLIGSPGNAYETYRGVTVPLLGWQVVDGTPLPAPAIVANQPGSESWLVAVVSRSTGASGDGQTGAPEVTTMSSPEDWALTVPTRDGPLAVGRSGDAITATPADPMEAIGGNGSAGRRPGRPRRRGRPKRLRLDGDRLPSVAIPYVATADADPADPGSDRRAGTHPPAGGAMEAEGVLAASRLERRGLARRRALARCSLPAAMGGHHGRLGTHDAARPGPQERLSGTSR